MNYHLFKKCIFNCGISFVFSIFVSFRLLLFNVLDLSNLFLFNCRKIFMEIRQIFKNNRIIFFIEIFCLSQLKLLFGFQVKKFFNLFFIHGAHNFTFLFICCNDFRLDVKVIFCYNPLEFGLINFIDSFFNKRAKFILFTWLFNKLWGWGTWLDYEWTAFADFLLSFLKLWFFVKRLLGFTSEFIFILICGCIFEDLFLQWVHLEIFGLFVYWEERFEVGCFIVNHFRGFLKLWHWRRLLPGFFISHLIVRQAIYELKIVIKRWMEMSWFLCWLLCGQTCTWAFNYNIRLLIDKFLIVDLYFNVVIEFLLLLMNWEVGFHTFYALIYLWGTKLKLTLSPFSRKFLSNAYSKYFQINKMEAMIIFILFIF